MNLIVEMHCKECNTYYSAEFSNVIVCPNCGVKNDCIKEGEPTTEWLLKHK